MDDETLLWIVQQLGDKNISVRRIADIRLNALIIDGAPNFANPFNFSA
jgi:hypothetical protein